MLQCDQIQSVGCMAHLKQGSLQVLGGDRASLGQPLDTKQPTINTQRSGSSAAALDSDPLPKLFAHRYLDRIESKFSPNLVRNVLFKSR
ncbi:MAG TPA: hypothetical protein V6C57_14685 [Coleofasciculaceae cyanobacterium]